MQSYCSKVQNVHAYLQQAIPWLNGYGSLLPQFHFCYLQPQSEDLEAGKERRDESSAALGHTRGSSTLFLDLENKTHSWSHRVDVGQYVRQYNRADASTHSQGINYLLKTGPDLLSFCSSAMFAPLLSKRKEKGPSEKLNWENGWVWTQIVQNNWSHIKRGTPIMQAKTINSSSSTRKQQRQGDNYHIFSCIGVHYECMFTVQDHQCSNCVLMSIIKQAAKHAYISQTWKQRVYRNMPITE